MIHSMYKGMINPSVIEGFTYFACAQEQAHCHETMKPGPKPSHLCRSCLLCLQCQLLHFCIICCAAQLIPGQVRVCHCSFPTSQMILCMSQTVNQILLIKYATCALTGEGNDRHFLVRRKRDWGSRGEEAPRGNIGMTSTKSNVRCSLID